MIRFTNDGFHEYRNDAKKSSIQGTHVTYEEGLTHALTSGHIPKVLLKNNETKTINEGECKLEKQANIFEYVNEEETKDVEAKPFKYASLFSGIGGFESALNPLGGECVFASEFDKFAQQSYTALYGDEHLHGDITKIEAKHVPDHDVLVGGFPCQAFSVAGKRGGFEDARGTLFFHMARIAKEKQPKVIVAENVKGLVGHDKGKTLDTIVKTLNQIGYRVDFEVLNSKYFGVPQNRERIFIVGVREDLVENEDWSNVKGNTIVPKGKRRISGYDDVKTFNFNWPENDTVTKRLVDVLEETVDEKYYLSEEKTAQLTLNIKEDSEDSPDKIGGLYGKSQAGSIWDNRNISPTLKTTTGGYSEPLIPEPRVDVVGNSSETGHGGEDVYSSEGLSPTLLSRDYKGAKQIAEGLPIKEATKKGYSEANEGDSVNYQYPDSKTRRGRVGKQLANTLEASGVNQGVVVRKVYSLEDLEERFMNESDFLKQGEIKQIIFDEFGVDRKCNRCTNQVLISDMKGYPYLCFECDENLFEVETYKDIEMVIGSTQKNAATTDGTLSPTLTSAMGQGGGHVPMAVYKELKITGDSVNISFPDSETGRGRVGKQTANTLLTGEEQGVFLGVGHHPFSKKREFNGYGDLSPTLIATDYKAPKTALMSDFRIRKLTPLECWRLQGFTDEQHNAVESAGISNSQRYKQAGNAVTVNVIKAIGERLIPYL